MRKVILLVATVLTASHDAAAAPVDYLKVCSVFGAGFFYIPGTSECLNATTGDARLATSGGVWRTFVPNAPFEWVSNPAVGCGGDRLVDLGVVRGSDLLANIHGRLESQPISLALGTADFVSKFMMTGGLSRTSAAQGTVEFAGVDGTFIPQGTTLVRVDNFSYTTTSDTMIAAGTAQVTASADAGGLAGVLPSGATLAFGATGVSGVDPVVNVVAGFDSSTVVTATHADLCFAYRDATLSYVPLGCEDAAKLAHQAATIAFVPRASAPPSALAPPVSLVAAGRDWPTNDLVEGTLHAWACIANTSGDGAACRVTTSATGATLTCAASVTSIPAPTDGAPGRDGTNGNPATACKLDDHGDGSGTLTCPDGTSAVVATVP